MPSDLSENKRPAHVKGKLAIKTEKQGESSWDYETQYLKYLYQLVFIVQVHTERRTGS